MKSLVKVSGLAFAALTLTACVHDGVAPIQKDKICLEGVAYHKVTGSGQRFAVAVAYNTDGTIQTCEWSDNA